MKKLALSVVVAGVFLAGCGGNLPKEITSHKNFGICQKVETAILKAAPDLKGKGQIEFYNNCLAQKEAVLKDITDKHLDDLTNNLKESYKSVKELGLDPKSLERTLKEESEGLFTRLGMRHSNQTRLFE